MNIEEFGIRLTKGDSGALEVQRCAEDGAPAPFLPGDVLHFTVKHFPGCKSALLQKSVAEFPGGEAQLEFAPEDTGSLEPGVYWYDLQLSDRDGGVTTLAGPSEFVLGGEVTDV